jgi:hypothetical protein
MEATGYDAVEKISHLPPPIAVDRKRMESISLEAANRARCTRATQANVHWTKFKSLTERGFSRQNFLIPFQIFNYCFSFFFPMIFTSAKRVIIWISNLSTIYIYLEQSY